jgi:tRNA pseudouridine55 synthase
MLDGFLLIDKPKGVTSHDVVESVRKLLPRKVKVGHTGTLDPLATGLLILAVGKATKFSQFLQKQDKCYEVEGEFGLTSDTYDVDGKVERVECGPISEEELLSVLPKLRGEILQVPPPFSAVRVKGRRAYELARKGEKVELPPRKVKIHSLELLRFNYPRFLLKSCVSSGTFVRSLVHDLGELLGCSAVVVELRRVSIGSVPVERAVPLDTLNKENLPEFLIPVGELLPFPKVELPPELSRRFCHGQKLPLNRALSGKVKVYSGSGKFLGVGELEGGRLRPLRVFCEP